MVTKNQKVIKTMMDNNDLGLAANKSIEVVKLLLLFAYKWEKKEFINNLNMIVKDLMTSLSEEERNEFTQKVAELGLMEENRVK